MDINLFMALFAEAAESAPAQAAKSPQQVMFSFAMLLGMGLIIVWMLFILPRRGMEKRANQQKKLLDGLVKNDRVMTTSGIIGLVHSVDKEAGEIVLKVDESNGTKLRFRSEVVYYVFPKEDGKEKTKE